MPAKKERVHVLPERHSDSLPAGQSGDRIPVGVRYSAPVQTGPEAHPASYTMGRGADHPPSSSAEVKERVELYLYSPIWAFVACSMVTFTFNVEVK